MRPPNPLATHMPRQASSAAASISAHTTANQTRRMARRRPYRDGSRNVSSNSTGDATSRVAASTMTNGATIRRRTIRGGSTRSPGGVADGGEVAGAGLVRPVDLPLDAAEVLVAPLAQLALGAAFVAAVVLRVVLVGGGEAGR